MDIHKLSIEDYVRGVLDCNRATLSRAITLIESTRSDHQATARQLVERLLPHTGAATRIGVTGAPGTGKSTFIDALGTYLLAQNQSVAVLAIDPSSKKTKGSILGDKTRMPRLAAHPHAFIRPSPNAGREGGLAGGTRQAIVLLDAAGYDVILVETVGVGQSEINVHTLVDMLLLLLITGAGDDIQGIKRGIREVADVIVINKADRANEQPARQFKASLENLIQLMPPPRATWSSRIVNVSSIEGKGLDEVWALIREFDRTMRESGAFSRNRQEQALNWLHDYVKEGLLTRFLQDESVQQALSRAEKDVSAGATNPVTAGEKLLDLFFRTIR